jgi:translation initiation factor IF-3
LSKKSRAAAVTFLRIDRISAPTTKRIRRNHEITAPQLRVIGADGEQVGVMSRFDALELAASQELDLIEVSPMADPPVCRIIDFGKFQFETNKKAALAKKKQKQIQIKEVKFRPGTDEGDYKIKLRNLIRFFEEGDKAKVTLRFRGREMAHTDLGRQLLMRLQQDLAAYAVVEQHPLMEGRQMVMMLAPKKK